MVRRLCIIESERVKTRTGYGMLCESRARARRLRCLIIWSLLGGRLTTWARPNWLLRTPSLVGIIGICSNHVTTRNQCCYWP